ncbi:MAG TPA: CoA-acylating methylmalonate-semialdehyde dehydrogenase [Thermoanaerobaculia bacterium]|nr:CoA-acylating methylmalonate-semialdehyde dehydrogenase [Thermoanaerobaculia bacterium]
MEDARLEGGQALPLLIGGKWRASTAERSEPVVDPTRDSELARVPFATAAEIDDAVAAALGAFRAWRDVPVPERAQLMFRYKRLLEDHLEELARLVTRENGKLIGEARGEVRRGIEVVDFAAGMPTLAMGETVLGVARKIDSHTVRVPLGVVAGITPFNFPAMIPLWMFPVAIAAGNTFVLKPSERTPMTAVRLAELLLAAGVPDGVLNLVHGGSEAVDALLDHPGVRAVSFVGSEPVARHVYARAAAAGKRVQAMAGAKNHLVVLPDAADWDLAIEAVMASAFGSAGQRCLAGSVALPVGAAAEPFLDRLARAARAVVVGDPLDETTGIGPVIRQAAKDRILDYVDRGQKEGARLLVDGRRQVPARGFFVAPTILDEVDPEAALAREEIFGPVLSVVRVPTVEAAVELVNRSKYGNAASIFTRSGRDAWHFRTRVEAGMVGINVGVAAPMAFFPFAGWKSSFFGDLHATGKDSVRFYTESRVVVERWE